MGDLVGDVLGKPDAPQPPDYASAAAEQGRQNLYAAIATGVLNRPNEVTPFGTRRWNQTGSYTVGGQPVPLFTGSTEFTPTGQALFDKNLDMQMGMADLGTGAVRRLQGAVDKPLDFSAGRDAIVDAMYRRYTRMLDPRFAQQENSVRTDLVNRGFTLGDAGYDRAMGDFNRSKEFAYGEAMDRAMTTGANQRISEIMAERSLPMQELNALRTGAMPQVPNFQPYAGAGPVQAAPTFAASQAQGNAAMQQYGIESSNFNNMFSGLAGIGAAYLGRPI